MKMMQKHVLKLIALLLSLFLWAYVLSTAKLQIEKEVAVDYMLPEGQAFSSAVPRTVTFIIETPRAFIRSLTDRSDKISIDLTKVKPRVNGRDSFNVEFKADDIKLPFGAKVIQILPKTAILTLERNWTKKLPVLVSWVGDTPPNEYLRKWDVWPSMVEVKGPKSFLQQLQYVETQPTDPSELKGKGSVRLSLPLLDERLKLGDTEVMLTYETKKDRK